MRKEKALIALLRGVADLIAHEAANNPEFAQKVDALLTDIPERKPRKAPIRKKGSGNEAPPDIYGEWQQRGETEFRLWARDLPLSTLRAVIRSHEFDPTRRTAKWKEAEKLAAFIADNLRSRVARGSSFVSAE